jgi:hypothetical protein
MQPNATELEARIENTGQTTDGIKLSMTQIQE